MKKIKVKYGGFETEQIVDESLYNAIYNKAVEDCKDIVPFRIDDGDYADGFNDCSKKVLDKLDKLKVGAENE